MGWAAVCWWLAAPVGWASPPGDTGDADGDGVTVADGDCDDLDPEISPRSLEVCSDQLDNDCDGLFDEGCDSSARMAELRGGGGCSEGAALILFVPGLLLFRRRLR